MLTEARSQVEERKLYFESGENVDFSDFISRSESSQIKSEFSEGWSLAKSNPYCWDYFYKVLFWDSEIFSRKEETFAGLCANNDIVIPIK